MDQGLRKPVVKTGWLQKTGGSGGLTGWKDRYCVLSQGKITYYKSEKTTDPQGLVDLSKCVKVEPLVLKKGYGFQIEMPDRTYHFSAEKEEDRNAWITAVMEAVANIAVRSGSISSVKSFASSASTTVQSELNASVEEKADDDDIVSFMETQVESLKQTLNSTQSKLKTATTTNENLESQLSQSLAEHKRFIQKSAQEKTELQKQVEQLQNTKLQLETVNDSMTAQLEEHKKKEEQLEEELEEVQRTAEQDNDAFQSHLADMERKFKQQEHLIQQLETELKAKDASLSAANATLSEEKLKQRSLEQEMAKKYQSLLEQEKASTSAEKHKVKDLQGEMQQLRKVLSEKDSTTAVMSEQKQKWQTEKDELLRNHTAMLEQSRTAAATDKKKLTEYDEFIQKLKTQVVNKDKQIEEANLALSEERTKWQAEKEELTKQNKILSEQHRATAEDGRKKIQELEGSIQQLKTQLKNKESSLQVATTALSEEKTRLGVEKEEISKKHQILLEQERNATAAEKKHRKELETVMQKLKDELGNRDNNAQLSAAASLVESEERLKRQAERDELIREHQALLDRERTSSSEEKRALQDTVHNLERKYEELGHQFAEEKQQLELQCQQAQGRIEYLDQEIVTLQEQLNGLQVQKDKALADLSAIRKTNKDMERRLSETETVHVKIKSPSALDHLPEESVPKWDMTPGSGQDGLTLQPPQVRTKTEATVGTSSVSPSSPTYILPERTVSDSIHPAPSPDGAPPPKPKRPPAELINKFDVPSKPPQSFMQGLFARLQ